MSKTGSGTVLTNAGPKTATSNNNLSELWTLLGSFNKFDYLLKLIQTLQMTNPQMCSQILIIYLEDHHLTFDLPSLHIDPQTEIKKVILPKETKP